MPADGQVFDVPYPFVRERIDAPWEAEPRAGEDTGWTNPKIDTWNPGTRYEAHGREGELVECVADAMGAMLLTVVSVHRLPGRYAPRVFYTRQWRDPDGKTFGKGQLRIIGLTAFTTLTRGYRFEFDCQWVRCGLLSAEERQGGYEP